MNRSRQDWPVRSLGRSCISIVSAAMRFSDLRIVLWYELQVSMSENSFPDTRLKIPCSVPQGISVQALDFRALWEAGTLRWCRICKISLINSLFAGKCGARPVRSALLRQPGSQVSTAQNVKSAHQRRLWQRSLPNVVFGNVPAVVELGREALPTLSR
jgi:hypothetical protein